MVGKTFKLGLSCVLICVSNVHMLDNLHTKIGKLITWRNQVGWLESPMADRQARRLVGWLESKRLILTTNLTYGLWGWDWSKFGSLIAS